DAPVILIAPGNQSNSVGEEVTLLISASDPDTDQALLTYSAEGLPPGLAIDSKSGLITGMVTDQAEGKYMAQLTVSDGELSDSVQFQWMVSPKQTPTLYLPIAPNR
ncbi:MAG: putative Ig domain-containing protein, partial [Caldilineaceae bacterium]|nr:putative Ig domain-containing protein [Caldilineaceae bacterium]